MDIKVSLPKPDKTTGQDIKSFLRQLELCVHHLQKSVEEIEKDGKLDENTFVIYRHPKIDYDKYYKLEDEGYTQEIEIEIATA